MENYSEIRKNAYFDSVTLMLISSKVEELDGVIGAAVMMGTDHNKDLMMRAGLLDQARASECEANDLVISVNAENESIIEKAKAVIEEQFSKDSATSDGKDIPVKSIEAAYDKLGGADMCVVSLPGRYAKREVMKALKKGVHVLLFSDNVSVEDEIELKDYAIEHDLLMMGPDCGTAIIGGTALGFANVVKRGYIGLVAAAGTGLQEVSVIIDSEGSGISEAIGTGGRDVKEDVNGRMMLFALDALESDPDTKVIGIIGKPPAASVLEKIKEKSKTFTKPVVAVLIGAAEGWNSNTSIIAEDTLEKAALRMVAIDQGIDFDTLEQKYTVEVPAELAAKLSDLPKERKFLRGLYSGGTLCAESQMILEKSGVQVFSNIVHNEYELKDVETSVDNTLLDMGDDYFTDGMPHPMIDPRMRNKRLAAEARDPETAVILFDCVLGYGSHEDPAGAIASVIEQMNAELGDRSPVYVASVCGTDGDFQSRTKSIRKLEDAGVFVMKDNAGAAILASKIMKMI